ncbi:MAG: hypothetical protein E7198_10805 [Schwartzia succinivorans]|uniref:hypothetical protein n=1 Tax=Schwartzia succinivorans TaxID=55507 RepID=UPI0023575B51|nr:hypothetical protein [Schwartzia succinivorans]MBE6098256.1 hypothetical protein [Schwartzia succinivorans]
MKKMTIEQLQRQLDELQKAYNEQLKKERLKIGEAVQKATGLNTAQKIFKNFDLVKKEAVSDDE